MFFCFFDDCWYRIFTLVKKNPFLQPQGPPQQGQQRVIRVLHQPRARMHYVDSGRQMVPQNAQGQQPGQRVMILRPANNHPGQQPQHRIQGQVGPRIVGPGHPQGGQPRYQQMQVVRPMHPGQQQRPIRVMQHHQPQVQPPQRPRPQYQQYHPRPPGPPQPGQPQGQPITVQGPPGTPGGGPPSGSDVILNVEHHFMDNGKLVKKVGFSASKAGFIFCTQIVQRSQLGTHFKSLRNCFKFLICHYESLRIYLTEFF